MANVVARSQLIEAVTPSFIGAGGVVAAATLLFASLSGTQLAVGAAAGGYIELLMLGVPAVGLGYAGYWLHFAEFEPGRVWRIGAFAFAGAVIASVGTILVGIAGAVPAMPPSSTFVLLVATGTEGGLLGVLVGTFAATDALFRRERAAADEFEMLHGLLRHNLRNRLTIISGHLTLLAEELDSAGGDAVATIEAQLEAIEWLLEDTRLATEAVWGPAPTEPVDLVGLVRDQLRLLEASYEGLTVEPDLPERASVRAGDLLAPVIENVLSNAVVHHDRPDMTIALRVSTGDGRARLRVADDGPGIPADRRAAVFEAGIGEGTGMGLYLARAVLDRYGGTISVDDNEPRGTVVTITLPRADDP